MQMEKLKVEINELQASADRAKKVLCNVLVLCAFVHVQASMKRLTNNAAFTALFTLWSCIKLMH